MTVAAAELVDDGDAERTDDDVRDRTTLGRDHVGHRDHVRWQGGEGRGQRRRTARTGPELGGDTGEAVGPRDQERAAGQERQRPDDEGDRRVCPAVSRDPRLDANGVSRVRNAMPRPAATKQPPSTVPTTKEPARRSARGGVIDCMPETVRARRPAEAMSIPGHRPAAVGPVARPRPHQTGRRAVAACTGNGRRARPNPPDGDPDRDPSTIARPSAAGHPRARTGRPPVLGG